MSHEAGRSGRERVVLGLETSCDETAAAVVVGGRRVLSNVIASQHELHEPYAGVVPEIASRAHVERILPVVREALAQAGVGLGMVDAVAVGHRPGLIGCLLVGVSAAKALAWSLGRPLVGVDHVHAHLYSGMLEGTHAAEPSLLPREPSPQDPALGLVVSGGHTAIYRIEDWADPRRVGGTIDDAVGEAFDKAATILGLPHPGGPNLDRLADRPGADDRACDFPISRLGPGSLDLSFSGLKTALLYEARGVPGPRGRPAEALTDARKADLAASFRRAAVDAVMLKLDRALHAMRGEDRRRVDLFTGGGVTANGLLRAKLLAWGEREHVAVHLPPMPYCTDNAAMIAGLAHHLLERGRVSGLDLAALPVTGPGASSAPSSGPRP